MIFRGIGFIFLLLAVVISSFVVFGGFELTGFGVILVLILSFGGLLLLLSKFNPVNIH